MTQPQPQPQIAAQSPQFLMVPVREGNGLGVAGFFIALIGLAIPTGIIAILGLLVSLVALGKSPRGFAAMGVIVGLVGTVFWLVLTGVAVLGAVAVLAVGLVFSAGAFILTQPEVIEVTSDMVNMSLSLVEYEKDEGRLPADLSVLGLGVANLTDPWGNPYRYELIGDDPGFDVVSNGSDGIPGTHDDMALSRIDRIWENAFENFGVKMNDLGQRLERLDGTNVKFDGSSYRVSHGPRHSAFDRYEEEAVNAAVEEAIEAVKARELAIAEAIEELDKEDTGADHAEAAPAEVKQVADSDSPDA